MSDEGVGPVTGKQQNPPAFDVEAARAAAAAVADGHIVMVVTGDDAAADGNAVLAAQFASASSLRLLLQDAIGLIWLALPEERCEQLGLGAIVNTESQWRPTQSISIRGAPQNGASIEDRARTIEAALDPTNGPDAFSVPGHVVPIRARLGGVLERAGRTEAGLDLVRLAGCLPGAALSPVLTSDGSVARGPELRAYAEEHGLAVVSVDDVIALRRSSEKLVHRFAAATLPTEFAQFKAIAYRESIHGTAHLALVRGDVTGADEVLVHVHSSCLEGDVFHSRTCPCSDQLRQALERLGSEDRGVLVYIANADDANHRLQRHGIETPVRDRINEVGIGAQILADLGLTTIRVLTDDPRSIGVLDGFGLQITEHVPLS